MGGLRRGRGERGTVAGPYSADTILHLPGSFLIRGISTGLDSSHEAISNPGDGFDVPGSFRGVPKHLTKFLHGRVQAVFEVDESIAVPEFGLQLLPSDDPACVVQQQKKNLERLAVQFQAHATFAQASLAAVEGEIAKA